MIRRLLAAVGLRPIEEPEEEQLLGDLAHCTADHDAYLAALRQAVEIAKLGGIDDGKLEALVALGTWRMMSPATEERLRAAGIDTRPWRVVEAEWKAGRP